MFKTTALCILLCESKTLFVILREMHNLRLSENKLLKRNFDRKREEVTGGFRKMQNKELHKFYTPKLEG
jgi:hypothetical protein